MPVKDDGGFSSGDVGVTSFRSVGTFSIYIHVAAPSLRRGMRLREKDVQNGPLSEVDAGER